MMQTNISWHLASEIAVLHISYNASHYLVHVSVSLACSKCLLADLLPCQKEVDSKLQLNSHSSRPHRGLFVLGFSRFDSFPGVFFGFSVLLHTERVFREL